MDLSSTANIKCSGRNVSQSSVEAVRIGVILNAEGNIYENFLIHRNLTIYGWSACTMQKETLPLTFSCMYIVSILTCWLLQWHIVSVNVKNGTHVFYDNIRELNPQIRLHR